jgi:hypothetical protein
MAATDDPVVLGLSGPGGREFRVKLARGSSLRRGREERFVFAGPGEPETNVANPELNDPTSPPLDAAAIEGVFLQKGFEPIPNVRALGEMDDRLEIVTAEVAIHARGRAAPLRFARRGPIWLGLVSGLRFELAPVPDDA